MTFNLLHFLIHKQFVRLILLQKHLVAKTLQLQI